jgi:sulfur oxidation c-type cytochrome SoxX
MGVFALVAIIVIALSVLGSKSTPGANRSAPPGKAEGATQAPTAMPSGEGEKLVKTLGCLGCHTIGSEGGKVGPDLSAEGSRNRSREWLAEQIRNPKAHNPASVMPSFSQLDESQINALIDYLMGLKADGGKDVPASGLPSGPAVAAQEKEEPESEQTEPVGKMTTAQQSIGNPEHGEKLFERYCTSCHGPEGKGGVPNPGSAEGLVPSLNPIDEEILDKDPVRFVAKIDPYLQDGATPPGPAPALKMPDFGRSLALTQAQISHLEAYVLDLNGVRRDEISVPGVRPVMFFFLVLAAYVLAAAGIGAYGMQTLIARPLRVIDLRSQKSEPKAAGKGSQRGQDRQGQQPGASHPLEPDQESQDDRKKQEE